MLYIDVFRDFRTDGFGGGTRLRYVQMRSRRAGTAHRGRRSAAPARARYRAKTEKFAFGTASQWALMTRLMQKERRRPPCKSRLVRKKRAFLVILPFWAMQDTSHFCHFSQPSPNHGGPIGSKKSPIGFLLKSTKPGCFWKVPHTTT